MPRQIASPQPGIDHSGFSQVTSAGGQRSGSCGVKLGASIIGSRLHDAGISGAASRKLKSAGRKPACLSLGICNPAGAGDRHRAGKSIVHATPAAMKTRGATRQQIIPTQ